MYYLIIALVILLCISSYIVAKNKRAKARLAENALFIRKSRRRAQMIEDMLKTVDPRLVTPNISKTLNTLLDKEITKLCALQYHFVKDKSVEQTEDPTVNFSYNIKIKLNSHSNRIHFIRNAYRLVSVLKSVMRSSNHFACLLSVDKEFVEKCMLYVHLDALSIKGQFFLKNEDHASAQSYFTMALHDVLQNTAYEDEFQEVRIHLKIQLDSVRLIIADNRATFSVDQPIKIDENMPESAKAVFSSDGLDSFFDKKGFVLGG